MKLHVVGLLLALFIGLVAGFTTSEVNKSDCKRCVRAEEPTDVFHDMQVNPVSDYINLIEPTDPTVVELAGKFSTLREAYDFVSNDIEYLPFDSAGEIAAMVEKKGGSCLGKAALLASLYRAMGLPEANVRIVIGLVITPQGPADHAWVDLEYEGHCYQQDPSGMMGQFAFDEFPDSTYVETYVMKEIYCFTETTFALVSQLNRFKGGSMPKMGKKEEDGSPSFPMVKSK